MAVGVFMRHQTSNNNKVQNKTISETNAQGACCWGPRVMGSDSCQCQLPFEVQKAAVQSFCQN